MPAIKIRPSNKPNIYGELPQKRDFWGDADRGRLFLEQIELKFGSEFGSRKVALETLKLQRRLFNMYITGERNIPDELWKALRSLPKYVKPAKAKTQKRAKRITVPLTTLYIDDVDPLS